MIKESQAINSQEAKTKDFTLSVVFLSIVTLLIISILFWSGYQQNEAFKSTHTKLLNNSVHSIAVKIEALISERSRVISAIANDNRTLLLKMLADPDNHSLIEAFEKQLRSYYPNFVTYTIVDKQGNRVPDDMGELIGDACVSDINKFQNGDTHLTDTSGDISTYKPIIHPQAFNYHFDIMGLWSNNQNNNNVLFVSYVATDLSTIIRDYQTSAQSIYLVRIEDPQMIEVSVNGSRDRINREPKLSPEEQQSIMTSKIIPGTRWQIVGQPSTNLLTETTRQYLTQYGSIAAVLLIFYVFSLRVLYRLNVQKQLAFKQLSSLNNNLEDAILKRTLELSKLNTAIKQIPIEIIITDAEGKIEYVNPRFTELTGYSEQQAISYNLLTKNNRILDKHSISEIWKIVSTGEVWHEDVICKDRSGREFWLNMLVSPVRNHSNEISQYIIMGEDISEKKALDYQLKYQAHYDELTHLPNRVLAKQRLADALKSCPNQSCKVAVILIDLDDFKKVNDTLGHQYGDALLIESGRRLNSTIKSTCELARLGGDEFLVILPDVIDTQSIELQAEKIISIFAKPFILDEMEFIITASIGISTFPDDGLEVQQLLRKADSAMYQSKSTGRNTYNYFSSEWDEKTKNNLKIEQELANSLEQKQFYVVYQPIVDLANGHIVGCEALIRSHNPLLSEVGPEKFIRIAEQTGLIIPIGELVLETACKEVAEWNNKSNQARFLAVNLSPRQLWRNDFSASVVEVLEKTHLPPSCLELEVTEGMVIKSDAEIDLFMDKLNELGVIISMDDFGTGYSSLYHLKRYPFKKLKIDRSFIRDLADNNEDLMLVNAAIAMAHGLELDVVAEGIETMEQLNLLRKIHCEYGQGYLFSKPVPMSELMVMSNEQMAKLHFKLQDAC